VFRYEVPFLNARGHVESVEVTSRCALSDEEATGLAVREFAAAIAERNTWRPVCVVAPPHRAPDVPRALLPPMAPAPRSGLRIIRQEGPRDWVRDRARSLVLLRRWPGRLWRRRSGRRRKRVCVYPGGW
jgi:hypothetical protein